MSLQMRTLLNVTASIFLLFIIVILFEWAVLNAVLGCRTWDETKWTSESSCVPLKQLLR